jgi:hypothetical protein
MVLWTPYHRRLIACFAGDYSAAPWVEGRDRSELWVAMMATDVCLPAESAAFPSKRELLTPASAREVGRTAAAPVRPVQVVHPNTAPPYRANPGRLAG